MWNTQYANRKCQDFEKIREHKMHLERLVTIKRVIDIKEPNKPGFLVHKAKNEKMTEENNMKVNYENLVLLGKIRDIENKPSPYNNAVVKPIRCPAFDKTTFQRKKKNFEIDKENLKLYYRLKSAQPHYKTNEVIKDYVHSKYLESMISNTKSNANPSLFFETPGNFRRKLESYIFQNNNNEVLVNNANIDDSKLRPQSAIPQRITSATAQRFKYKKSMSGASKNSVASTNYLTHNEILMRSNNKIDDNSNI